MGKNYGGAYDIDTESYFGYDDMVVLAIQINDILESKGIPVECERCFVGDSDRELEADCVVHIKNGDKFVQKYVDLDGATFTSFLTVDFRGNSSPSSLISRLAKKFADIIEQDFRDMCELELDVPDDIYMSTGLDDKDPVYGDDYGFGFDSNGDPIDESTVEELARISEEIIEGSELGKILDYIFVNEFNYNNQGGAFGAWFELNMQGELTDKSIDIYKFLRPDWDGSIVGFPGSAATNPGSFKIDVRITLGFDGKVDVKFADVSVYDSTRHFSDYDTNRFFMAFDEYAIIDYIKKIAEPVCYEIASTISNI